MDPSQVEYSFKFSFEENFDVYQTSKDNLSLTPLVVAVLAAYVVLIVYGEKWMADREAFNLKKTLMVWNFCMAAISGLAVIRSYPRFSYSLTNLGLSQMVCNNEYIETLILDAGSSMSSLISASTPRTTCQHSGCGFMEFSRWFKLAIQSSSS